MYINMYTKKGRREQVPVAEARRDLPALIRIAERGKPVAITRRGRPVAVLVSIDDYQRVSGGSRPFTELYETWRAGLSGECPDAGPEYFDKLRDRSEGRDVVIR
jgi:prevent-host-death family protein